MLSERLLRGLGLALLAPAAAATLLIVTAAGCGPTERPPPGGWVARRDTARLKALVARAADRRRVPRGVLLGLVERESSWDPAAKSPTGATGMLQFTAATARDFGLVVRPGRDDRLDPVRSADAGARYLRLLWRDLAGARDATERWRLAVAAYNRGPGTTRKALAAAKAARVWDGSWASLLQERFWDSPAGFVEVRRHVQKILGERGPAAGYARLYGYGG